MRLSPGQLNCVSTFSRERSVCSNAGLGGGLARKLCAVPNRDHPNDAALVTIEEAVRRDDEFSVWQLGELRNRAAGLRKMLKAPELCLATTAKAASAAGFS
jgi:hypothetical protein